MTAFFTDSPPPGVDDINLAAVISSLEEVDLVRTVISLDVAEKRWLDAKAKEERVAMTEIVRRAIRAYREAERRTDSSGFEALLRRTAGIWKPRVDGLEYQNRLRTEWPS